MLKSLRAAERAMQIQQTRIDSLANNLANVDTAGFKQILTRVAEIPSPAMAGQAAAGKELEVSGALDPRPGSLSPTGRSCDLAIIGEGFFVVETPDGEFYTRDGSFRLDENRQLVTADGKTVVGTGGPLKIEGSSFSLAADGSLLVDGTVAGRLKVVSFANPTRLEPAGESLLAAPPDLEATPVPKEQVQVVQGHLERSNVSPIDTLVDMIAAQRAFEIESKILATNDQLLERSVNQLGRSK